MKILHGTRPSRFDKRDFSLHRTFPQFGTTTPPVLPFEDYTYDIGVQLPDQNVELIPYGCTGETQTDIKTDQDRIPYDAEYTYRETCFMEGHAEDQGCDIRTSVKCLRDYGARPNGKPETEAQNHRSGFSFNVDKVAGRDWFDSFRIALRANKQGISVGTPWFPTWNYYAVEGVLPSPSYGELKVINADASSFSWHNYALKGEIVKNDEPMLRVKAWGGTHIGDKGWLYMNRDCFNKAFDIYGTIGLVTAKVKPEDIKTIVPELWQLVYTYLNRLLKITGYQLNIHS